MIGFALPQVSETQRFWRSELRDALGGRSEELERVAISMRWIFRCVTLEQPSRMDGPLRAHEKCGEARSVWLWTDYQEVAA